MKEGVGRRGGGFCGGMGVSRMGAEFDNLWLSLDLEGASHRNLAERLSAACAWCTKHINPVYIRGTESRRMTLLLVKQTNIT